MVCVEGVMTDERKGDKTGREGTALRVHFAGWSQARRGSRMEQNEGGPGLGGIVGRSVGEQG